MLGRRQATLAVPEPARALVVAAIEAASSRHPLVVAVPTTTEAERLVAELGRDGADASSVARSTRRSSTASASPIWPI